ncbi:MAG: sodium:solute symporter family protein [Spirochaeta sp.]|jgi:SSS family solute:Na+ symporter|nr:sodium:solute symporter family protein [Spirochaeta sp.]
MAFTIFALTAFGAVIVFMAAYGYRISAKTAEDYMLGGRTIGVVVMFFFVLFAISSAWTFYGFPGLLYTEGPGYVMFIWGSVAGFAGLYMFFGPRLWALAKINRYLSPVEVLAERYESKTLRFVLSVSILLFVVPYVGIQPLGVGAGFEALTGLPAVWGAVYTAVILIVLVLLGGMRIVAWVNIFLGVVYVTALLGSLIWVVTVLFPDGGLVQAVSILQERSPEILSSPGPNGEYTSVVLAGTFVVGLLAFAWPHVAIGCMTARDKSLFKWFPLLIFVFGGLFFYIIPFIWGSVVAPAAIPIAELSELAASNGVSLQEEADRVVQTIISRSLPEWFGVYVLLGVIAAAVSTAAVQLMTSSVIVSRDVIQGFFKPDATDAEITAWARWSVVVIVILSTVISFFNQGAMALYLTDVSVPGFAQWAPALVGGLLWKRGTRQGAIGGTVAGVVFLIVSLLLVVDGERILVVGHPVIGSLLLNTIVYIVVSYLTPRPSEAIETQFFDEVDDYLKAESGA